MMTEKPINILIAVYNGEKYLDELLDSVLNQTYTNKHIYILDDGSSDGSMSIIDSYVPKGVHVIENHHNLGYPYSFYKLLQACDPADYYFLCDQDDVWNPEKVSMSVKKLESVKSDRIKLCFSAFEYCDRDLTHIRYSDTPPEKITFLKTLFQSYLWGFTVAFDDHFRRLFLSKLPDKTKDEDYWFQMMAAAFGELLYCPEVSAKHRRHGKNHSTDPSHFIQFQLWRIKYFLKENQFAQYHTMLQEFYQRYQDDLSENDRCVLALFQSDGHALRKFFYPHRLRSKMVDEVLLRVAFLMRKL